MSNAARKTATQDETDDQNLEEFLRSQGYKYLKRASPKHYHGLMPMIFTWGLFCNMDRYGYSHRYCYHTLIAALGALKDWADNKFEGEPKGYIVRK